jgi:hypothetical protein
MYNKTKCHKIGDTFVTYDKTIFSKLSFIDWGEMEEHTMVYNDWESNKIDPQNKNIIISGYNINLDLFRSVMDKVPNYLNIDDIVIKNYILYKYGDITNATMLGIRIGEDFKHMKCLTNESYLKALDYLKTKNESIDQIYVIGDMPSDKFFNNSTFKDIDESDIVQFYFGTMCKNYILSESTFHLWIAYLGTKFGKNMNKTVICFNNSDIVKRSLHLDNWITIDY